MIIIEHFPKVFLQTFSKSLICSKGKNAQLSLLICRCTAVKSVYCILGPHLCAIYILSLCVITAIVLNILRNILSTQIQFKLDMVNCFTTQEGRYLDIWAEDVQRTEQLCGGGVDISWRREVSPLWSLHSHWHHGPPAGDGDGDPRHSDPAPGLLQPRGRGHGWFSHAYTWVERLAFRH